MSLHLSPGVMDVAFLVVFASFFSLALVTYAVRVRLGLSTLPPLRPRGAGRRLLPALLVGYFYWLTKPVCRIAIRSGQSASFFTVLGLVLAFATGDRGGHRSFRPRLRPFDHDGSARRDGRRGRAGLAVDERARGVLRFDHRSGGRRAHVRRLRRLLRGHRGHVRGPGGAGHVLRHQLRALARRDPRPDRGRRAHAAGRPDHAAVGRAGLLAAGGTPRGGFRPAPDLRGHRGGPVHHGAAQHRDGDRSNRLDHEAARRSGAGLRPGAAGRSGAPRTSGAGRDARPRRPPRRRCAAVPIRSDRAMPTPAASAGRGPGPRAGGGGGRRLRRPPPELARSLGRAPEGPGCAAGRGGGDQRPHVDGPGGAVAGPALSGAGARWPASSARWWPPRPSTTCFRLRAGDVARLYMLESCAGIGKSAAMAIAVVEKLLEVVVLAALALVATCFAPNQSPNRHGRSEPAQSRWGRRSRR